MPVKPATNSTPETDTDQEVQELLVEVMTRYLEIFPELYLVPPFSQLPR